jgi:exodeoxyribonuclease VII small subunit
MKKNFKYEEAVEQLEQIVRKMENDELDIDSLTDELRKAQELIKLCKAKLTSTDAEIKKMLEKDKTEN